MAPVPMPPPSKQNPRFNLRLEPYQRELLEVVAWYFNEVDKITGAKRLKWTPTSLIEHYVSSQLDTFIQQVGLGSGTSPSQLKERLHGLVEEVVKEHGTKK